MATKQILENGEVVLQLSYEESVEYQQHQLTFKKATANALTRPDEPIKYPEITKSRSQSEEDLKTWALSFGDGYKYWKLDPDFLREHMETDIPYLRVIVFDQYDLPDDVRIFYKMKYPNGLKIDGHEP